MNPFVSVPKNKNDAFHAALFVYFSQVQEKKLDSTLTNFPRNQNIETHQSRCRKAHDGGGDSAPRAPTGLRDFPGFKMGT